MNLTQFFTRRRERKGKLGLPEWDLATPLIAWSSEDRWTIRDAIEGTLVLGATGSGKTSGSGRNIALAFLRNGFGGLILTAKSDERENWERYCAETNRSADLVVVGADSPWCFNFLDHERNRSGVGAGQTENIVSLLSTVLEVAERGSAGSSGGDDAGYWRRANRQLCRNAVDLLSIAKGRIAIPDLYRLVISAPTSIEQLRSEEWKNRSFCFQCLGEADRKPKSSRQSSDFEIVADYFMVEFPGLSEKTRSVVVSTLTSMIDVLNRGVLRELFCGETNISPEAVESGKIILIDLPVKEFSEIGQFSQVIWKHAFQRSIERRSVSENARPVFLWADEMQNFVTSYDMQFQATCRSARVATVLLTQNVSNVYAALGGNEKGKAEAASLFANLNMKVWHAQSDPVTNEWAASVIGRSLQQFANGGSSSSAQDRMGSAMGMNGFGYAGNTSAGFSESYDYDVQPSAFTRLRTGGPDNNWVVDGIVLQNGRVFQATGKNWLPVSFAQKS